MPRTTREYLLRYIDQFINNLTRAIADLEKLISIYCGVEQSDTDDEQAPPFDPDMQPKDERYLPYVEGLKFMGRAVAEVIGVAQRFKDQM